MSDLDDIARCAIAAIAMGSGWIGTFAALAPLFPARSHTWQVLTLPGIGLALSGILGIYAWFALSLFYDLKAEQHVDEDNAIPPQPTTANPKSSRAIPETNAHAGPLDTVP